ncbi:MAG TPA: hypothetical protein VL917_06985, partial [Sphingomicrobium sp.]|nr:hypothetical protein [Sphingomicrobium sp.]
FHAIGLVSIAATIDPLRSLGFQSKRALPAAVPNASAAIRLANARGSVVPPFIRAGARLRGNESLGKDTHIGARS